MKEIDFKKRTMEFAVNVINFVDNLPKKSIINIIGNQLVRSATSVGANYRAVCRARSTADFISKLGIVEEEADETMYWLEILAKTSKIDEIDIGKLKKEANEITAIVVASLKTAKKIN